MLRRLVRAFAPVVLSAALLAAPAAAPALAAPTTALAVYSVFMGGTQVAKVTISLADDAGKYQMNLDAHVSGLASLVASGTASAVSKGRATSTGYRSDSFAMQSRASGGSAQVDITYRYGDVDSFVVTPPVLDTPDRVPIERRQLVGNLNDMLAAFVLKARGLDKSLCSRRLEIFTGIERYNLNLSYVRDDEATSKRSDYRGPLVACQVRYQPISGHYEMPATAELADNQQILLWYAPLFESGLYIPYRALVATESGDLSIVLTRLSP